MYSVSTVLDQIKLDIGPDLQECIIQETETVQDKHRYFEHTLLGIVLGSAHV